MEKQKAATQLFQEQVAVPMEGYAAEEAEDDGVLSSNEIDSLLQSVSPGGGPAGPPNPPAPAPAPRKPQRKISFSNIKTSEELQLEKDPIRIRETGRWLWKRVIVPPNAYVVQTRINRAKPVSIGLGKSFRYRPKTDAYLIVPAALQTIGVVANCISREKQGINVLAYVQWQIDDFAKAFKRLDFSDRSDPLSIVNAQLREQAEAAIKDKIATMSVEEVLTDKAPIIEELTLRLREVTEGRLSGGAEDSTLES
ncbi:MAG: SPFH domain-containing protein, partial [Spirochaetia bacterium]